jgi:hypothetical protein
MKSTFTSTLAARAIERILAALKVNRMTARQLAVEICMSVSSAQLYLAYLQKAPRRVRICGFEPGAGLSPPIYSLGTMPNAKRPPKRTPAGRFAALKAEPFEYQKSLALRRLSRLRAQTAKTPNTWASALFAGVRVPTMNAEG